ncbi:heme peroxidase [Chytriomyces cf. hyalinus JEL632]|nr:heme peroxidase [Chytriomyces cf. hyalinus JEL632]
MEIAKNIKDKCPVWNPYYKNTLTDEDWMNLRYDLVTLIQQQQVGPVLVRLAWHDAATCNKDRETGGPHATILVQDKAKQPDPNNAGLDRAIKALAPIYKKYKSGISNADLWSYAGALAISVMGGPVTSWQPGRNDYTCLCQADLEHETNNIPSATDDFAKLTATFARMGFNPLEMGTLNMGGHSLGRCHKKVSGYHGSWTPYENTFTNGYALLTPLTPKTNESLTLPGGVKSWQSNFMVQKDKYVMALPSDEEIVGNLLGNPATTAAFLQIHGRNMEGREYFFGKFQGLWKRLLDCNIDGAKLGRQCVSTYQSDLFGLYECPTPGDWVVTPGNPPSAWP